MESIGFPFYYFDFVVNSFDFSSMDGIITVVDNAVSMSLKHVGKSG